MNRLSAFTELIKDNLYSALAIAMIVMITSGYLFYYTSTIGPGLAKRDALITQVASAQKSLVDSGNLAAQSPSELQAKLASAQATLTASQSLFLSDTQASQITDVLYQYANASKVTITDLQTQPAASQGSKSSLNVTTIRLQAQGDSKQLVEFMSRIKEATSTGFLIDNFSMSQGATAGAKLAMDVTLYSSPLARGNPPPAAAQAVSANAPAATTTPRSSAPQPQLAVPVAVFTPMPVPPLPTSAPPQPTATFIPPTPIPPTPIPPAPALQVTIYVVRPGDTLFSLARRYGTTIEAIMAANHLASYQILIGQPLIIPAR